MNDAHRQILTAILAESTARRGPCPPGLVAVALNIGTSAGRERLDRQIGELLRSGCLEDRRDPMRGNGLVVTEAGERERLAAPHAPTGSTPGDDASTEPPATQPTASQPVPADSTADADLAAEGWSIMTELAGVAFERLRRLPDTERHLAERARLYAMLRRYQAHTATLLERYGGEA